MCQGWGNTAFGGNGADTLQKAMLAVADDDTCSQVMSYLRPVNPKIMICAGRQGKVNHNRVIL